MKTNFAIGLFVLLLTPLSIFASPPEAQPSPIESAIEIEIPKETLESLAPLERIALEKLIDSLKRNLWTWSEYPIELPETVFPAGAAIIDLKALFRTPKEELKRLAVDESGMPKALSDEQKNSIKEEGLFVVPDGKNYHVWKIWSALQKGAKNIRISIDRHHAGALKQLFVYLPERFKGENVSLKSSAKFFGIGLRRILGTVVGLIDRKPKYSDRDVSNLIEQEFHKYLRESNPVGESSADLRLYNPELMEKVAPILASINEKFVQSWEKEEPIVVAEVLRTSKTEEEAFEKYNERRYRAFYKLIWYSKELDEVSPGIQSLLVYRHEALRVVSEVGDQFAKKELQARETFLSELASQHPKLAQVSEWREKKAQEFSEQFARANREALSQAILSELKSRSLENEAKIFEAGIAFYANEARELRKSLTAEQVFQAGVKLEKRIWRAKNWEIVPVHKGFRAEKYETSILPSNHVGWRATLALSRTYVTLANAYYFMLVSNFWNGPVGVKSLFLKDEFSPEMVVEYETGKLVPSQSKTGTLRSRIKAVWNYGNQGWRDFQNSPESGFLPKKVVSPFVRVRTQGLGCLLVAGVCGGQVGATALNTALTGVFALTPMIWAPGFELARNIVNWTVRDYDYTRKWVPLIRGSLETAVLGVGQAAVSLVGAAAHPVVAGGWELKSLFQNGARKAWDSLVYNAVLKRGHVPDRDAKYLVSRIQGPGVAASHFYQIQPDLALVGVQAVLEKAELDLFERALEKDIRAPYVESQEVLGRFLGWLTKVEFTDKNTPVLAKINEVTAPFLEDLRTAVSSRKENLPLLEGSRFRIRLLQKDLETLRKLTALKAEEFYDKKLAPHLEVLGEQERLKFWNSLNLKVNDFTGFGDSILKNAFGPDILAPLEEADLNGSVQVVTPKLSDYLDAMLAGDQGRFEDVEHFVVPIVTRERLTSRQTSFNLSRDACSLALSRGPH